MTPIVIDLGITDVPGPECWEVCEDPAQPIPNAVSTCVHNGDGIYTLTLNTGIADMAQTTIKYLGGVTGGGVDYVRYVKHPGNADGGEYANANDIIVVVNCLNAPGSCEDWEADIDFSGAQTANDIIEVINLLNGTGRLRPRLLQHGPADGQRALSLDVSLTLPWVPPLAVRAGSVIPRGTIYRCLSPPQLRLRGAAFRALSDCGCACADTSGLRIGGPRQPRRRFAPSRHDRDYLRI